MFVFLNHSVINDVGLSINISQPVVTSLFDGGKQTLCFVISDVLRALPLQTNYFLLSLLSYYCLHTWSFFRILVLDFSKVLLLKYGRSKNSELFVAARVYSFTE